LIKKQLP